MCIRLPTAYTVHSDQGTNFESNLVAELLWLAGVAKSHTTAYHPMGNGVTERFNRTLGSMLRTLPLKEKQRWPEQIQTLTFAYNATIHETTGYAPFYLMFGRVPRLPVDIMFNPVLNDSTVVDYDSYVKSLISSLKSAIKIAQKHSLSEQQHQSHQYNKQAKGAHLSIGDRVLVANKGERGKRKLADKWEDGVYTVVGVHLDIHVYKIQNSEGCTKIVHRNLLMDASFLPFPRSDDGVSPDVSVNSEGFDNETSDSGEESLSLPGDLTLEINVGDPSHSMTSEVPVVPEVEVLSGPGMNAFDGLTTQGTVTSVDADSDSPAGTVNSHSDTSALTDSQSNAESDGQFRTRAGQLVKSVNRLIESMIQRPFVNSSNILHVGPSHTVK